MTLLLIFDALADGTITPDTEVTTSEYAASMGGSQVFLEAGEKQTVDTMIKCIAVQVPMMPAWRWQKRLPGVNRLLWKR